VRRWTVAIIASVIAHAVALVWAVPAKQPAAGASRAPASPGGDGEPVAIVLLDDESGGGGAGVAIETYHEGSEVAISSGNAGRSAAHAASPGTGVEGAPHRGPAHSPLMRMREPDLSVGALSSDFIEKFLRNSKPLQPLERLPEERIADELKEARKNHDWERVVALNEEKKRLDLAPSGGGTYRATKPGYDAKVERDGTNHLNDRVTFDASDAIMRAYGVDPYASEKLRLLERTRDQRALIGKRYRHDQLSRSAEIMQNNIERAWLAARDVAERKQLLFELWDDCAETGDDELVAGGNVARELVLAFIHAKGIAYTPDELARFNAKKTSRETFAP